MKAVRFRRRGKAADSIGVVSKSKFFGSFEMVFYIFLFIYLLNI